MEAVVVEPRDRKAKPSDYLQVVSPCLCCALSFNSSRPHRRIGRTVCQGSRQRHCGTCVIAFRICGSCNVRADKNTNFCCCIFFHSSTTTPVEPLLTTPWASTSVSNDGNEDRECSLGFVCPPIQFKISHLFSIHCVAEGK